MNSFTVVFIVAHQSASALSTQFVKPLQWQLNASYASNRLAEKCRSLLKRKQEKTLKVLINCHLNAAGTQ